MPTGHSIPETSSTPEVNSGGDEGSGGGDGLPRRRSRPLGRRRPSHQALLFVPLDSRRISIISGNSVNSCPCTLQDGKESTVKSPTSPYPSTSPSTATMSADEMREKSGGYFSPPHHMAQVASAPDYTSHYESGDSLLPASTLPHTMRPNGGLLPRFAVYGADDSPDVDRRSSVQTGAPIIAFRTGKAAGSQLRLATGDKSMSFKRRASQPVLGVNTAPMGPDETQYEVPKYHQGCRHSAAAVTYMKAPGRCAGGNSEKVRNSFSSQSSTSPGYSVSPLVTMNLNHIEHTEPNSSNSIPIARTSGGHSFKGRGERYYFRQNETSPVGSGTPTKPVEKKIKSFNRSDHLPGQVQSEASLAKRVSWLSMKSLQDVMEPLLEMGRRQRQGSESAVGGMPHPRSDSRTNSQFGSALQLNEEPYDMEVDTPPIDTMSWSNMDEFDNVTLMYSKHEKIPMKDFGSEIRATMDIDHLLNKAVLLLDLQETSLEEIFAKIIHEMDIQEPEFTSEQVRSVLFTQDTGNQFHILSRTVQSICTTGSIGGSFDYDQSWICALCMLNTVQHRHVAIARLSHPTNLGRTMQDLRFIIIVIAPSRAKGTKTALETTRTFATLFADMDIRQRLVMAHSVEVFRATLLDAAKELALEQSQWRERKASIHLSQAKEQVFGLGKFYPFRGLLEDFRRRKRHYIDDYIDGLRGHRTAQKMFSSIIFLYFACLLPAIAFGVLNDDNTNGGINVRKVIFAQAVGGIFFALFGGQPMIILLTTVPLAIYIKVIYRISEALGYDFFAMYACVGLWCQLFLIFYAATELCSLMKLATRSAEEMFSLFIAIAFTVESIRAIHTSFVNNYQACVDELSPTNHSSAPVHSLQNYSLIDKITKPELQHNISVVLSDSKCHRDTSILYVLLMCGTLWLALFLYNFRKTPYLTRARREWLADYALPASVLLMSFAGAYCFSEIDKDMFKLRPEVALLSMPAFWRLSWPAVFVCMLLGFFLSFLFYMDQNITSAIVNNPQNKLKKGNAHHLDLFVVAILNMFLSIFGLPWMHGALPHSPLHVRALADVEERVAQGHVHEVIMNVRETRLASLIAHLLILASTFSLLPFPLQWIPTSVLHGLFLYMAFTSLTGNEMVERLLLLITEQQAYPPTHYIRRVPQRKVHLFTACQLIQLVCLCAVGFSPYPFIEMIFPIVCFCFLPIRHMLIPKLIDYKYLDALDGRH